LCLPGWKHLLLADAPRQVISALTLYSFAKANKFETDDLSKYYDNNWVTATLLVSMIFTVIVFAADMILLISAAILYIPLLCYIQGNLKVSRISFLRENYDLRLIAPLPDHSGVLLPQDRQGSSLLPTSRREPRRRFLLFFLHRARLINSSLPSPFTSSNSELLSSSSESNVRESLETPPWKNVSQPRTERRLLLLLEDREATLINLRCRTSLSTRRMRI